MKKYTTEQIILDIDQSTRDSLIKLFVVTKLRLAAQDTFDEILEQTSDIRQALYTAALNDIILETADKKLNNEINNRITL